MSSIWNIFSPIRTGVIKMAGSGNQLFGTVVQHGVNYKTVTVRVSSRHWQSKYGIWLYNHINKQVHDQYNYCVTGDKVIIKLCEKLSNSKSYYVKRIVKPFGRDQHYVQMRKIVQKEIQQKREKEQLQRKNLELSQQQQQQKQ